MRIIPAILAAATLAAATGPALADSNDPRCGQIELSQWMSVADISAKAQANGLTVREVDRDHGCYEVKGIDAKGQRLEITMHPVSGEVIKTEIDD